MRRGIEIKLAVFLSGTIRAYERSVEAIQRWRKRHDVDVFIHVWRNVADIHKNHWQLKEAFEPTPEIIDQYQPRSVIQEDWKQSEVSIRKFADYISKHRLDFPKIENISPLAMYYSINRAWSLRPDLAEYDLIVRMRFDGAVHEDIFDHRGDGWMIPHGNDFGGVNDRLGWLWIDKSDMSKSFRYANAYLGLYSIIESLLLRCEYNPEILLKESLDCGGVPINRFPFRHDILGI